MERCYTIEGRAVRVSFDPGIIHIASDSSLLSLLKASLEGGASELVISIKRDYKEDYGEELGIKDDSLIVEIWGHVYFGAFIKFFSKIIGLSLISRFGRFISRHCDVIDCGEADRDGNRRLWDWLAPYKDIIRRILKLL